MRKAFADLFELPMGISPSSKHDFCLTTDPTAKPPHCLPYRMLDSDRVEFKTQIAKLLAMAG
jgi:hypothetical protein